MGKENRKIICRLTGVEGVGVRAHIIPKALYQLDGKIGYLMRMKDGSVERWRSPSGEYDSGILVGEGESYFSSCDDYAVRFLLNKNDVNGGRCVSAKVIRRKVGVGFQEIVGCYTLDSGALDVRKFKMFAMSVLWRASVSDRMMFRDVDVGCHEERIRSMILKGEVGGVDDYSVVLARWEDTPETGLATLQPMSFRADGLRFYRFDLPQITFFVKVDKRPLPPVLREVALGSSDQAFILGLGRFHESGWAVEIRNGLQKGRE